MNVNFISLINFSSQKIEVPIIDTNNHSPKFLKKSYEFDVPMPIPAGFVFTEQIVARDVDLTNKAITFVFEETDEYANGFLITGLEPTKEDKKNYPSIFKTSKTMDFEKNATYTLYATVRNI